MDRDEFIHLLIPKRSPAAAVVHGGWMSGEAHTSAAGKMFPLAHTGCIPQKHYPGSL